MIVGQGSDGSHDAPTPGSERPSGATEDLRVVATGATIGFIGKLVRNVTLFLFAVVVARLLGRDALGVLMLCIGTITLTAQMCLLGLDRGVVKFVAAFTMNDDLARNKGVILGSLATGAVSSGVAALILFGTAGALGEHLYHDARVTPVLRVMTCFLPAQVLSLTCLAVTRGMKEMKYTAAIEDFVQPGVSLIVLVLVGLATKDIMAGAWAYACSVSISLALALLALFRTSPALRGSIRPTYEFKTLYTTSVPLGLSALSGYLLAWLSSLIVGVFWDSGEVALLQVALRASLIITLITVPINLMIAPVFAGLHSRGSGETLRTVCKASTRWSVAVCIPIVISVCLWAGEFLWVFGDEFRAAQTPLLIIAMATLLNASFGPAFWMLQMTGREKWALACTITFVAVLSVSSATLVPRWGAVGAALATAASIVIFDGMVFFAVRRVFAFQPFGRALYKPIFAGVVSLLGGLGLTWLVGDVVVHPVLRLVAGGTCVMLTYGTTLFLLGMEQEDKEVLAEMTVSSGGRTLRALMARRSRS